LALDNSPERWQAAFWRHTAAATARLSSQGKMLGSLQIIALAVEWHSPDGCSAAEVMSCGGQWIDLAFRV